MPGNGKGSVKRRTSSSSSSRRRSSSTRSRSASLGRDSFNSFAKELTKQLYNEKKEGYEFNPNDCSACQTGADCSDSHILECRVTLLIRNLRSKKLI
jgi:hypothetical protein